ncbi:MAG TPA: FtsX-like permease family protein [Pyrinomonadaceae bacterium]|jgi:ABC-type antimicrobial peptide transport system permease subunit
MPFLDILYLSLRNLREAKLRATLTTMGVIVGVAVIVTMVSFGLGLQRNTTDRFKALDLFNELTVSGQSLASIAMSNPNANQASEDGRRRSGGPQNPNTKPATRILDEAAIAEIEKIPGVAYVEPFIRFSPFMRSNGRVLNYWVGAAKVPNESSRFKEFAAGSMISSNDAAEVIVTEDWARDFGYEKPEDAVGKTVEFLAPPEKKKTDDGKDEDGGASFFGIPLDEEESAEVKSDALVARSFRIVGVLKKGTTRAQSGGGGGGGIGGFLSSADVYVPLKAAREWTLEHRNPMAEVALELARAKGAIEKEQVEGFTSATVRVTDPVALTNVRNRLTELGFQSFSIVDQLEQLRTVFLILNATLGLLGGISLLVASFGIANTMIMSILERTREIGIMKAIGAEDSEIRLIFFAEAAVIGFVGGVIGVLAAWGIDALANRLAYRFILKPQNASFVDFFYIPPYLWAGAIAFAVLVSIIAALYPASRAARIDPVRALRHD